jgi:tetratricopeptide (TPR) repeat protein
LNDLPNAEKYFQSALEQAPEDPAVLRGNAEFRLGTMQPQAAEPVLQSILREDSKSGDTDQAWARRSLALIIGLRGNDEAVATARKLLDENAKKAGRLPEDQRVLARILAGRSDAKETNEAISILETITKNAPKFSLIDNALLASLYQKTDDWNRYSRIMRTVMGNGGAQNPQIVSSYAAALVQHGDAEEGKLWLDRLKAMAPNELANMAIEAELLFRSGAYQRLEALLRANVEFPGGRLASARVAESAARRLESDKKTDQAKPFRALATELYSETIKVDPERKLALAGMHARDGEMERVIEELAGLEVVPPVEFGEMIQSALQAPQLTPEAAKQIIPMIQSMIAKNPEDQLLRICLGDYYSWANEPEQARAAYLEVLQKDPNFVPALNNLAMILAATGTRANEAADAIDKAVALVGPTDYLLDTRGIVRMAAGNLRGAEEDLRRSIEADGRADRYFHLALVLLAQGRIPDAKQMLSKAEQGGVSKETLHPIERDAYQKLVDAK